MIDYKFVEELEGNVTRGYVPRINDGPIESGVTIGMGIDLGQYSAKEVERIAGTSLMHRLQMYCLAVGSVAEEVLKHYPLYLNARDVALLNSAFVNEKTRKLTERFNRDSEFLFVDLPDEFQTVTFSLTWQYGNLKHATPNYWHQVTNGKFKLAYENLRNFGDSYSVRRNKEADYVESWVLTNSHGC